MAKIYKNYQKMNGMGNGYNSSSSSSYDSNYPSSSTNFNSMGSGNYSSNNMMSNGIAKRMRKSASINKAGGGWFDRILELLGGAKKPKVVYPNKEMFDPRFSGTSYDGSRDAVKDAAQTYLDGLRRERLLRDQWTDPRITAMPPAPKMPKPQYEGRYRVFPGEFSSRGRTRQQLDNEIEGNLPFSAQANDYTQSAEKILSNIIGQNISSPRKTKSTTPKKPKTVIGYKPFSDLKSIYDWEIAGLKAIEDAQRPLKSTTPRRPSMAQLMSNIEAPPVVATRGSNSRYLMVNGIPTKSPFPEMDAADVWLSGQPKNKIKNQTRLITDKVKDDMLKSYSTNKRMAKRANWPNKNKYFS